MLIRLLPNRWGKSMPQGQDQPLVRDHSDVKTILLVEDDIDIGTLMVEAISEETPYKGMLVNNGFQALKIVHGLKPNLFLLDYGLPRMNGIELYDTLHTTEGLAHVPALIVSAQLPIRELGKRHLVGIKKPFELSELLATI